MKFRGSFEAHLAAVRNEQGLFLPFIGGEAARLERCAIAVKRCMGVETGAALDPWRAAQRIGVKVRGQEFFSTLSEADRVQVLEVGGNEWSAGTVVDGETAIIFLNPTHELSRQKVTLAEELTHLVMGHPPSTIAHQTGMRTHDGEVEAEAYGVGGAMVLPYPTLFRAVKARRSIDGIAEGFAVSVPFVNYRINRTGLRRMYAKNAAT